MYKVIKDPTGVRVESDICPEIPWNVLNRLAQAIRGYLDGKAQWWLCRYDLAGYHEDDVEGPCYSRLEALTKLGARTDYGVFGPFRALAPMPSAIEAVPMPEPNLRILSLGASLVEKVVVTLRGSGKTFEFEGDKWDALFWTLPAVEKFVIPYYVTTGGIAKGNEVKGKYLQPDVFALVHAPDTDYIVKKSSDPLKELEFLPLG